MPPSPPTPAGRWRRGILLMALGMVALTMLPEQRALAARTLPPEPTGPTAVPSTMHWLAGDLADHAPSGVPDFSGCRTEWSRAGSPAQWTYAAPVAMADALWWLDSVFEPDPKPPDTVQDGFGLVTAYPRFGPTLDDHAKDNLFPLVEDLAVKVNTDGRSTSEGPRGTRWESLLAGVEEYLEARRLTGPEGSFRMESQAVPGFDWLAMQAERGAGTVLLLGVWERKAEGWRRVGGHYVALAGAERPAASQSDKSSDAGHIAIADPLADMAALTGDGRLVPKDPSQHSCRLAPRAHDDAVQVSHDRYLLYAAAGLPDGRLALQGYFSLDSFGEAAAFVGQNPADFLAAHAGPWTKGSVVMAIDAALAVVPARAMLPTATPTEAPSPTSTPSPTPTATATWTASPTATSTATPRPTATPFESQTPFQTPIPTPEATLSPTPTASPTATFLPVEWDGLVLFLPWVGLGEDPE